MKMKDYLYQRRSVRAFTSQIPDKKIVQEIMIDTSRSPSGGNIQPWIIKSVTGEVLKNLVSELDKATEQENYLKSYPDSLWEPYRTRRFENGEAKNKCLNISYEDKIARLKENAKNKRFFDAPVVIFIFVDKNLNLAQWLDLGAYMQSFTLRALDDNLATCIQGSNRAFDNRIKQYLKINEKNKNLTLAFNIALGYEDNTALVNNFRSTRVDFIELENF